MVIQKEQDVFLLVKAYLSQESSSDLLGTSRPQCSAFFLKESKGEWEEGGAGDPRSPLPFYFFLE